MEGDEEGEMGRREGEAGRGQLTRRTVPEAGGEGRQETKGESESAGRAKGRERGREGERGGARNKVSLSWEKWVGEEPDREAGRRRGPEREAAKI